MAIEKVTGIAILSGKGGVGKSVISLNLALGLGSLGVKTLLYDTGGGDLANLTNSGCLNRRSESAQVSHLTDCVGLYTSSILDSCSLPYGNDVEKFLTEMVHMVSGYSCTVFDCSTGLNPIVYALTSLAEISIIVSTPDPTSIAGAYLMVKSLSHDGLAKRCEILFNQVSSVDEAASLKTKFDILTRQFLHHQFKHAGYIHNDRCLAESVLEQQPLMLQQSESASSRDFINLTQRINQNQGLQFETEVLKSHLGQRSYGLGDDNIKSVY